MTRPVTLLFIIALHAFYAQQAFSQDQVSDYDTFHTLPGKLFKRISHKTADINGRITTQTEKYLLRLLKEEKKLKRKLAKKDPLAAKEIFNDIEKQYDYWQKELNNKLPGTAQGVPYSPGLDTLQTAIKFIQSTDVLLKKFAGSQAELISASREINSLQNKFSKAEEVKSFMKNRKYFLQQQMEKYGLAKDLLRLRKQVYYYHSQVDRYKKVLENPVEFENKAVELLKRSALFKAFSNKHSELAGMFTSPDNQAVTNASFTGLQTRESVQQALIQRFGSDVIARQILQRQLPQGQSQIAQLKEKINQLGETGSDIEMPDFKPNNQKTRAFKDRIELGTNLQTVKGNRFFPVTSDIGLNAGYKLNDKSVIGIGASYKMGLGKDIRHIKISHQGIGLRSYVDCKLKGNLFISGGFEYNHQKHMGEFFSVPNRRNWQQSGLIGISKIVSVKSSFFRKTKVQLLWDFLSYKVPESQALKFRVGYGFR